MKPIARILEAAWSGDSLLHITRNVSIMTMASSRRKPVEIVSATTSGCSGNPNMYQPNAPTRRQRDGNAGNHCCRKVSWGRGTPPRTTSPMVMRVPTDVETEARLFLRSVEPIPHRRPATRPTTGAAAPDPVRDLNCSRRARRCTLRMTAGVHVGPCRLSGIFDIFDNVCDILQTDRHPCDTR